MRKLITERIQLINNQIKIQGKRMNNLTETGYSPLTTHHSLKKQQLPSVEILTSEKY